jgi:flagellar hook-basal body complex protein FliE
MNVLSVNDVKGDLVSLKVTNPNHITDSNVKEQKASSVEGSFADMFNSAIGKVNDLELKSQDLASQMAINPDSVNIHDVQIAAEEAEMSVLFTKGVVDRVIRAYKEITNLR